MDPNAEDRPPTVEVAEVDVEFRSEPEVPPPPPSSSGSGSGSTSPAPPPAIEPLLASSIFRQAFEQPPPPVSPVGNGGVATHPATEEPSPDPEQIKAWQEEEFQRRLRGEYQHAQDRLSTVINDNLHRQIRLTSIRLSPTPPHSRSGFLSSLLQPFIPPPSSSSPSTGAESRSRLWTTPTWLSPTLGNPPPKDLRDVLMTTRNMMGYLDKFGIWDMDRSRVRLEHAPGGEVDEVELVLALREKGRLFLKANTEVGAGEGGGNVTGRIRNALGGGESLEANVSIGTKTKSAYQVSLTTPLFASPLLQFAISGFSLDRDNSAFASHRERSQGARAKFSATTPWGLHDLTYEYVQRDITQLSPSASVSVRELAGPSTKSSLIHTWSSDTRDDPWLGTSGRLLKTTQEYAGLPGSSEGINFFKSILQAQLSRSLYSGSSINYSLSSLTTFLLPLSSSPTALPDRTYAGGPNSLRGFKVGGLGLRDGPDSLGGDLSWGAGLSVFTPIWGGRRWEDFGGRWHGFINGGKVVDYDAKRGFGENVDRMFRGPSISAGVGFMYRLDPIRIEINFSMPLVARKGERFARGFGVGVGLEFL